MEKRIDITYALEHGIIDRSYLQEQIEMKKREEILQKHKYKITLGSDGRYFTYLPLESGRRLVKKTKKEDLIDAIVEFYTGSKNVYTFIFVYEKWREYQDQMVSYSSVTKYDSDRIRFFDGEPFSETDILRLTEDDIALFIKKSTEGKELCKSACKTLFHYVSSTFAFAKRHKYISSDPCAYLRARDYYKYCTASERSKKDPIMSKDVVDALEQQIEHDILVKPNYIPIYAVRFASMTGMRVGEIAALKWEDVTDSYILVNKSQKYDRKRNVYEIKPTKNGKIREFPLTDDIKELLTEIREVEARFSYLTEFIFSNDSGPLNFRVISSCIKNKCRQTGVTVYGIHGYRKTLNSAMASRGVSKSVRASLLGHTEEVNERYYTFDDTTMEAKKQIMTEVYSSVIK